MKDWITKNWMRIFMSTLVAFGVAFLSSLIWNNGYFVPLMGLGAFLIYFGFFSQEKAGKQEPRDDF